MPFGTITSIAESPKRFGVLWAGTDEGKVWGTRDGGASWTDLSAGLAADRWVTRVVASAFDEGTVYVSQNGYRNDEFAPYLWRSADHGRTWESLAAGPAERADQHRPRGPAREAPALRGHRPRRLRLPRPRSELDRAHGRVAAGAGSRPARPPARGRPRRRHPWPQRVRGGGGTLAQADRGAHGEAPGRPARQGRAGRLRGEATASIPTSRGPATSRSCAWPGGRRCPAGTAVRVSVKDEHGSVWRELSATVGARLQRDRLRPHRGSRAGGRRGGRRAREGPREAEAGEGGGAPPLRRRRRRKRTRTSPPTRTRTKRRTRPRLRPAGRCSTPICSSSWPTRCTPAESDTCRRGRTRSRSARPATWTARRCA